MLPSNICARRSSTAPVLGRLIQKRSVNLHRCGLWLSALLGLLIAFPASADLMLYPTRVVLEKNQRAAQIELVNNGKESVTYRISLVNRRMTESGEFLPIESPLPGELFAGDLLRYSPRQVSLEPGQGQTIRISLRKPADLPVGEYRSHIQIDTVPPVDAANSINSSTAKPVRGEVGLQLRALLGVTIPVIVRNGDTSANVTLSDLQFYKPAAGQTATLAFVLQRSGDRSVYGDLVVTFTPHGGSSQVVGKANGLAVYSPNPLRRIRLALQPAAGLPLTGGTLHVTFRDNPDVGGKPLAEGDIALP